MIRSQKKGLKSSARALPKKKRMLIHSGSILVRFVTKKEIRPGNSGEIKSNWNGAMCNQFGRTEGDQQLTFTAKVRDRERGKRK